MLPVVHDYLGRFAEVDVNCWFVDRVVSLVDEGVEYADKLRMAGVPVDLEIYKGVTHEFVKMGRVIAEARQAHADMAAALKTAFELKQE